MSQELKYTTAKKRMQLIKQEWKTMGAEKKAIFQQKSTADQTRYKQNKPKKRI